MSLRRTLLVMAACFALSLPLKASVFGDPWIPTPGDADAATSADLDGNGHTDLVFANANANTVSVLLGNGDGTFNPPTDFGVGDSPTWIELLMLDADACLDLVTANNGTDDVSILLGNCDGTFDPETRIPTGDGPLSMTVADFDEDSLDDIAVSHSQTDDVVIHLSDGDGTFTTLPGFVVGVYPDVIRAGDFDNDGLADLAVLEPFQTSGAFFGNGDGTFGPKVPIGAGILFGVLTVGDFDEDGEDDIVMGPNAAGDMSVFISNGDGTFTEQGFGLLSPSQFLYAEKGDFNNDTHLDVVVTLLDTLSTYTVLGNGDGTFDPFVVAKSGKWPFFVRVDDFTGDSNDDMAALMFEPSFIAFFESNGDGTFGRPVYPAGGFPSGVTAGLFDGDASPDILVSNSTTDDVSFFSGNGDGTFADEVRHALIAGLDPDDIEAGELTGDSANDAVVARTPGLEVLTGDGTGGFAPSGLLPGCGTTLKLGFVDGDGILDLVGIGGSVCVALGNGNGTFQTAQFFAAGIAPKNLALGHFNTDAHLDVAVANGGSDDTSVLLGNGDGTLQSEIRIAEGGDGVVAADLGGNGWDDLVVGTAFGAGLEVLGTTVVPSNGDGTFGPPVLYPSDTRPIHMAAADFDNDLYMDIAVISASWNQLTLLLGHGDRTLTRENNYTIEGEATDLEVVDLNNDGGMDIVVSHRYGITAFVNQSSSNQPPVANAGPDVDVECASPSGAVVPFDASASTDSDSMMGNDDIVSFDWYTDFGQPTQTLLASGEMTNAMLPIGVHVVTLEVTDSQDQSDSDNVIASVTDTVAPSIMVSMDPSSLWPPNHRLVTVTADPMSLDLCTTFPTVVLSAVTSDQPDDAAGPSDGQTTGDIQQAVIGTLDLQVDLRAERDSSVGARTYTVEYTVTDGAGLQATDSQDVIVPLEVDGTDEPLIVSLDEQPAGTLLTWSAVTGALSYNVVRGSLANLSFAASEISLGTVDCVELGSVDTTTAGFEDADVPSEGQAFFYVAEYDDGSATGYGTASAIGPRVPVTINCP